MAHYGVSMEVNEDRPHVFPTQYSFVVDTTAQVRELLLKTTAPITKVKVYEEVNGRDPYAREMSAEEVLTIVLNHPKGALSLA